MEHVKEACPGEKNKKTRLYFFCTQCKYSNTRKYQFGAHMAKHDNASLFICGPNCRIGSKSHYHRHMKENCINRENPHIQTGVQYLDENYPEIKAKLAV
jgi:hypothetical protein